MNEWWHSLPADLAVFYGIAFIATGALFLEFALSMITGGAHDLSVGDLDAGGAGAHPAGLSVLSVRSVSAFAVGFGWTGVAALRAGWSTALAAIAAAIVGTMFLYGVYYLMRAMMRLGSSGSLDYRNAIGQTGTVYIAIPAALAGSGEIEVQIQGRLCMATAVTRGAVALTTQTRVRVIEVLDRGTLIVDVLS